MSASTTSETEVVRLGGREIRSGSQDVLMANWVQHVEELILSSLDVSYCS